MTRPDIITRLRTLIDQMGFEPIEPCEQEVPLKSLGYDSLDLAELVIKMEVEFNVTIVETPEPTFKGLVDLIDQLKNL